MTNAPVTFDYHQRTKLFPGDATTRRVDPSLIPKQYKRYVNLPSIPLPSPSAPAATFFETLSLSPGLPNPLNLDGLSAVLHYAGGIVRRTTVDGRQMAFRAASCTGALYHIELYVVCGDIQGLPAGVYHYDVLDECLRPLREVDFRRALADACCDEALASAAASVVLTSTFWRNAWRYEERAYRHVFWDAGTLLANLLAVATSHGLHPAVRTAFVDRDANALVGVDGHREAVVTVVGLGAGRPVAEHPKVTPLALETEPLSRAEIEYPLIWQTHAASSLDASEAVRSWREGAGGSRAGTEVPLNAPDTGLSLGQAIERRGSARRFSREGLSREAFQTLLAVSRGLARSDQAAASGLVRPLLIVNAVEGPESGAYALDGDTLSPLRLGDFAAEAGRLALEQPAASQAAVNLYFVASLPEVTAAMGERGYRAVQLEAGVRTGRVYLAAASLGLRATGLTFYDNEVASFFGLNPDDALVLMLVAFGA